MYRVKAFDQTLDWDEGFLEKYHIVKAEIVYVFDDKSQTYCCEFTPSFELWPVKYKFTFGAGSLRDDDWYEEADIDATFLTESIAYVHCHTFKYDTSENFGNPEDMDMEDAVQSAREILCL